MMSKTAIGLAFAASVLAMPMAMAAPPEQMVTNGPQVDPGDNSGSSSARQNVIASHR